MRNERLGLWMIGASLIAIALVSIFLVRYQAETMRAQIRNQGVSMVRLLAALPIEQVVGEGRHPALLHHLLDAGAGAGSGIGYAVLVDTQGRTMADATAPGTLVPAAQLDKSPTAWFGEHVLESPGDGRRVREFFGPVLNDGDLAGFVRLGFYESSLPLSGQQVPLLGVVALPVFLLAPMFYFLMRREVRPLADLINKLDQASPGQQLAFGMSGELREFVRRVNQFIENAQIRTRELEGERSAAVTSLKMLAYKRDRIEAVLQSLPEAVLVLDDSGVATFANRKVQALLGADPESILGHPPQRWCSDTALLGYLSAFSQQAIPARRADAFEYSPMAAPERRLGLAAFPLFSPQDPRALLGTLVVLRDITEQYLARNAGAEFVAHVSHELKSPLNVISMYSDLLLGEDGKDEALRVEATNAIHDNVERMANLIRNLLNISKLESGTLSIERQRVRLHEFLKDVFDSTVHDGRSAALRFDMRIPPEITPVILDKGLFGIAIKNLLTNAIKYNRPGGSVTLAAEETADEVTIRVSDTGIGIKPEDQARVFDKFFRSSASEVLQRSGHGLGLYLAREIVALHHGSLTLNSKPGSGTEFLVKLKQSRALVKESL